MRVSVRRVWTMGRFGRALSVCAAVALSGCALLGDQDFDAAAEQAPLPSPVELRVAALEAEVARLEKENAELSGKLVSALREADQTTRAEQPPAPDLKDEPTAALTQPQAAPEISPAAVVAAADADRALADAPAKPVEPSPRLVQPSFASQEEAVFENEAGGAIKTASVLFGVHLASYRAVEEARTGWGNLQREFPDELGLLEPRLEPVSIEGRGDFLRLIGGGFSSQEKAAALCANLRGKGVYCAVTGFEGERLTFGNSAPG